MDCVSKNISPRHLCSLLIGSLAIFGTQALRDQNSVWVNPHLSLLPDRCFTLRGIVGWDGTCFKILTLCNSTKCQLAVPFGNYLGSILVENHLSAVNGQKSTAPAVLSVPYNPAYPQFWSSSTNTTSEANFSVSLHPVRIAPYTLFIVHRNLLESTAMWVNTWCSLCKIHGNKVPLRLRNCPLPCRSPLQYNLFCSSWLSTQWELPVNEYHSGW